MIQYHTFNMLRYSRQLGAQSSFFPMIAPPPISTSSSEVAEDKQNFNKRSEILSKVDKVDQRAMVHGLSNPSKTVTKKKTNALALKRQKEAEKYLKVVAGGNLVNMYKVFEDPETEKERKESTCPNAEYLKLKMPFQIIVCGKTGAGKTNLVENLVHALGCFDRFWLYTKDCDELLYKKWVDKLKKEEEKLGETIIEVSNDIKTFPSIIKVNNDLRQKKHKGFLILDDMVNENIKDLKETTNGWTLGRKGGLSVCFITQSYFRTPKVIRENSSLLALGRLASVADMKRIVREYSLDKSAEELMALHQQVMQQGDMNFLLIDLYNNEPGLRYRMNLAPYSLFPKQ
jgi:hypothetical protein